jgi:hypothetical protein
MKTDDLIEDEYNGIKFAITQEAINDLLAFHNVDAIAEIKEAIDREQQGISINPTVDLETKIATLTVTKKE